MTDATAEFFNQIDKRGQVPFLRNVSGTLRFDIEDGDHVNPWYVSVRKGDVEVSHKDADADVLVCVDKATFEGIACGEINAMAAALRGVIRPAGDLGLLLAFARFFPGPPASQAATATAGSAGSRR
ncbi:MAG: SCP2 sterol-binding domain-containing protein [Candidatus Polarisedimenticolia bacterium]